MAESKRDYDVLVIGAGVAGIAACHRLTAARRDVLMLEARDRLGGRAFSVPTALGKPADLGCEWLHSADRNVWTGIARRLGFTLDETLPEWSSRVVDQHDAAAQADWLAARDDFEARCEKAAGEAKDRAASTLLLPHGRWNALLDAISTWANGTELEHVSVKDRQRYDSTLLNWRVLEGYGALITAYGNGLPVRFGTVVTSIDHRDRAIRVATNRGELRARAVIITLPTNVIAAETVRFTPALPDKMAAAAGLPLGIANKLFLALAGSVEGLPAHRHLVGSTERVATGNYELRPHGWPMISAYYGGHLAAELEAQGQDAMASFALDELAGILGNDIRRCLTPLASSAWAGDRFARGSYSSALPDQVEDRVRLSAAVDDRLFFAGEACSIDQFGTAHGAHDSGFAAANAAIAALGRS